MGQIFNRIKNIARAYGSEARNNSAWQESMLNSSDDELRRIIDELNSDRTAEVPPQPPPTKNETLPAEVVKAHITLNCPVGSSRDNMKKAYRTAISTWHPDRFSGKPKEEQTRAHQRAHEINAAYITLKNHYSIT